MRFNISAWAIQKPVPAIVLFALLLLLGGQSFFTLPVTRTPSVDLPIITIVIAQPGVAPEELETDVTRLVEDAVADLSGVRSIRSSIADGVSSTEVRFEIAVPSDRALFDVKNRIDALRSRLPSNIDAPVITRSDTEGMVLTVWQVSSPTRSMEELSWFVDNAVTQHLRGISGVGEIRRLGGASPEVEVALRASSMLSLGLTLDDVQQALQANRADVPAGHWNAANARQPLRVLGRASTAQEVAETPIPLAGHSLRLGDISRVTDTTQDRDTFLRRDGTRSVVALAVYRASGADEIAVVHAVEHALPGLKALAPDITFTRIDETVSVTWATFVAAMSTLGEGALLAVIVVFIFLRDWRATLIVATTIPLSIIPTFWILDLMGYSLNILSLLGVTLVTGILVDDAIVEIENIERHMHMGKSPRMATVDATAEIGLAVVAISVSVVAVFAPVSAMGGIAGQYFKQFGLTVSVAVLFSLLVARLITPMMAARILRSPQLPSVADDVPRRESLYSQALEWVVLHKKTVLLISAAIFGLSLVSASRLPNDLIPSEDTARLVFALEAPAGTTLSQLSDRTDIVAQHLRAQVPEIEHVLIEGGVSPTGHQEQRLGTLIVHLKSTKWRDRSQREVQLAIRDLLRTEADLRGWLLNDSLEREVAVSVVARNLESMREAVGLVKREMQGIGLTNVAADSALPRNELHILPRFEDAARLGISTTQIARAVRLASVGEADLLLPKLKADDQLVPIRVRLEPSARKDLELLRSLPVARVEGMMVPLSAVADVQWQEGPSSIERYNRQRRVLIGADLAPGQTLGTALSRILNSEVLAALPADVSVIPAGDGEVMEEAMSGFVAAMGLGLLLMFLVLVLLFSGVRQPLIIMLSLPLALTGAILALFLTRTPINLPVLIGMLMLMGIVAKNAIMLVDFAKIGEDRGLLPTEAIVRACRIRARPILMTTLAMTAGMLPSALGIGGGGSFRAPMAIVVIGGLLIATFLSLLTMPALFLLLENLRYRRS